jgi:short subunit dehydrogenase-like uncharacterized protein
MKNKIVIYGSYGYTGRLIVDELRRYNHPIVLAGRDERKLKVQSETTGLPCVAAKLDDTEQMVRLLEDAVLVIHCAGPFIHTAIDMVNACLVSGTHYTDITGEYQVFEALRKRDSEAKQRGITLMPGTGFDVVPSDCLANHLKNRLPDATHLELAFASVNGRFSRGTSRTAIENLGQGSFIRKDGMITRIKAGSRIRTIDFGPFSSDTACIPWGDIASAYHSTGIPNIEVYMGVTPKMIRTLKMSNLFSFILKQDWVKDMMRKRIDKKPDGPSENQRKKGSSFFYGRVRNEKNEQQTTYIHTMDGYGLTAVTASMIANKIFNNNFTTGYQTPAMAYGADLILEAPASTRTDV